MSSTPPIQPVRTHTVVEPIETHRVEMHRIVIAGDRFYLEEIAPLTRSAVPRALTPPKPSKGAAAAPSPTPSAAAATPDASAEASAAVDALQWGQDKLAKGATYLLLLGKEQLYKERSFEKRFDLGANIGIAPILHVRVLQPSEVKTDNAKDASRIWISWSAAAEIGTGNALSGTIPIAATGLHVSGGVGLQGLVEVEGTMPLALPKSASSSDITAKLANLPVMLVTSPSDIDRLYPGETRVMRGRGTAKCNAGIGYGLKGGFGPLSASLGINIDGELAYKGELAMEVKKLLPVEGRDPRDTSAASHTLRHDVVRLRLLNGNHFSARVQAAIGAHITSGAGSMLATDSWPMAGKGLLKFLCTAGGAGGSIEGFIDKYAQIRAQAGVTETSGASLENTLLFERNASPLGEQALAHALHWDFSIAIKLAELQRLNPKLNLGVRYASYHTTERKRAFDLGIVFLGQDILRDEDSTAMRTGTLQDADGNVLAYTESAPQCFHQNIVQGKEWFNCRATMLRRTPDRDGPIEPILEVDYRAEDFRTTPREVRNIIALAAMAGDAKAKAYLASHADAINALDQVDFIEGFTGIDNSERRAHVRASMGKLMRMPERYINGNKQMTFTFVDAFLQGCGDLDPQLKPTVNALCNPDNIRREVLRRDAHVYANREPTDFSEMFWDHFANDRDVDSIEDNLAQAYATMGIDLPRAAALLKEGEKFAKAIQNIQNAYFDLPPDPEKHHKQLAALFGRFFNEHDMHFVRTMAALLHLLEPDDVYIGELSVRTTWKKADGEPLITFKSSEGELRDHIADAVHKAMQMETTDKAA